MLKTAQTVEMSLDITDSEKKKAELLVGLLKLLCDRLMVFNNYLNKLYNPFKEHQAVSPESINKYRGSLMRFSQELEEQFIGPEGEQGNNLKSCSIKRLMFLCALRLKEFYVDTHIAKLLESFSNDATDVDDNVESLIAMIRNWTSSSFRNNVVMSMENTKKEISELRKLIEDRIIDHINTNILAKNWIEDSSQRFNVPIQEREPYLVRLFREREKRLNQGE